MLYDRQKRLLALVDALGGRVAGTDLQKLLLLWMQQSAQPAYEFVPYKFGAYSFTSYADKRKLIDKGLLDDDAHAWNLTPDGRAAIEPATAIRGEAVAFALAAPKARGEALVAHTYRRFPFFAIRSEIAGRVLADDAQALRQIDDARPPQGAPGIVTIGYEGRSLENYLTALLRAGVSLLCDVRRNPISRRYGFSRSTLAKGCENIGIRYMHLPELGIASAERKGLETRAEFDALFAAYARDSLPRQGAALATIAGWVEAGHRVALTCYEERPEDCHRHCVTDALTRRYGDALAPKHL